MRKSDNFYVRSSIFVSLSLAGAMINYLLYPVLSRLFNLRDFGDYVTVIALSNQVMGVLLAFSVISIAFVKQYGEREANTHAQTIQKVLLWIFLILALVVLIFSHFLQQLLKIQSFYSFIMLSLVMLLAVPTNIWVGYLQGHKELTRVGMFTLSTAVVKFVSIIGLAAIFGVLGGLAGFITGSLLGLIILYLLPGRATPSLKSLFNRLDKAEISFLKVHWRYILQSIFVVATVVFLQNYDLNRVKVLFEADQAGIYSGISVLSNALYYVMFLIIWVLLPEFSIENQKNNRRVLRTAYGLVLAIIFVVVVGGLLLGNRALGILLGPDFNNGGLTLVVASLYQISLVSVALYSYYLLLLKRRTSVLLSMSVLITCLVVPAFFSQTPLSMIVSLWMSVLGGVIVYALFVGLHKSLQKNVSPTTL